MALIEIFAFHSDLVVGIKYVEILCYFPSNYMFSDEFIKKFQNYTPTFVQSERFMDFKLKMEEYIHKFSNDYSVVGI